MKKQSLVIGVFTGAIGLAFIGCAPETETETDDVAQEAVTGTFPLQDVDTSMCVDVAGSSKSDGAALQQQACASKTSQKWTFKSISTGVYSLVNGNSGKCISTKGTSTAVGNPFVQVSCNSGSNTQWFSLHKTAEHTFRFK